MTIHTCDGCQRRLRELPERSSSHPRRGTFYQYPDGVYCPGCLTPVDIYDEHGNWWGRNRAPGATGFYHGLYMRRAPRPAGAS